MSNIQCPVPGGRFRSSFSLSLLTCVILAFVAGASGQSQDQVHVEPRKDPAAAPESNSSSDQPHLKTIRIDTNLVLIPVTVSDTLNHPVTSLGRQNFELLEGGEPQKIRYFSSEDAPISIGVLLDLSLSMKNKIDLAREALSEFFRNSNPQDDYFVLTFADRPELLADTTQSVGTLQSRLALATPNGNTALLDAIYLGIAKLQKAKYPRRALLIISDGGDNHSRYGPKEIRSLVQEADVEIYAIGIFDSIFKTYEEWAGQRLLTDITEVTGGHTITVDDVKKLPEVAAAISSELRNQYVIGYHPNNAVHDAKWHKIKVRLVPPLPVEPLHVFSKKGYMAPGS